MSRKRTLTLTQAAREFGIQVEDVRALITEGTVWTVTAPSKTRPRVVVASLESWVRRPVSAPSTEYDEERIACELCGSWASVIVRDHCHQCGYARGWLCRRCNIFEGTRQDYEETPDESLTWFDWRQRCAREDAEWYATPEPVLGRTCGRAAKGAGE